MTKIERHKDTKPERLKDKKTKRPKNRKKDNRWTKRVTDWHPYNEKRSRKRPDTRWRDKIEKFAGVARQRLAQDFYICGTFDLFH